MQEAKVRSNNKTYRCPSCDCICVNKCMLNKHQKACRIVSCTAEKINPSDGEGKSSSGHSMQEAKVRSNNKTHRCPSCDCLCVNKCMLIRHIGQKHRHQIGSGDNIFEGAWTNADGYVNETCMYHRHMREILLSHYISELHGDFNFPLPDGQITYAEIRQHIMTIYERLRETFKLNMSFGIRLRGIADRNLYQYLHPFESDRLIDTPFTISNVSDIDRFMEKLNDIDLLANMVKQRKNTKWLFFKLTNRFYYVNKTAFVLRGESEMLPKHILNSRAIHALTQQNHKRTIQ